ncbi:MAG: DNA internalization-related competence protein ComEC/Rec2 [Gammaproteobacteria bacterium]|nr:DNA internalization-related competence protein ComEC/Rec2 [Gammaproteobacteria bacterium]
MRRHTLFFLAGLLIVQFQPVMPRVEGFLALCIPAVWLLIKKRGVCLAFLMLGAAWLGIHANVGLADRLSESLQGKDLVITGAIASTPVRKGRATRFVFKINPVNQVGISGRVPHRVRLSWYGETPSLQVGQVWRLTVRLKRPRSFMNPGGFDYEAWLFQQGIRAVGYVRANAEHQLLDVHPIRFPAETLRQQLSQRLDSVMEGYHNPATIKALSLGYRENLPPEIWDLLRNTGTNHLMAISGLHLSLLAAFVYGLSRITWIRLPWLNRHVNQPDFAAMMAIAAAFGYAAMAGFSIPTQRAFIMLLAFFGGSVLLRKRLASFDNLFLALVVVLLVDPFVVMSAGFWLSFMAVVVIVFVFSGHVGKPVLWRQWGFVQIAITLILIPVTVYFFQIASLVSPIANLIAVPWVSFVVVPLVLIGVLFSALHESLGAGVLWLADQAIQLLWVPLAWLAEWPHALWLPAQPPLWAVILAVSGGFLLLSPRALPGRLAAPFMFLPLLFIRPSLPDYGGVHFHLLDVGQGLSAVVRTQSHTLLFDAGPRFSAHFNAGQAVVMPFLRSKGVKALDTIVISHLDNDHLGGAEAVLQLVPAEKLIAGYAAGEDAQLLNRPYESCQRGQSWKWDGVHFEFLHPPADHQYERRNNRSCVLKIDSNAGSILLTGDIERQAEKVLLNYVGSELGALEKLRSDLLVAPHHGSLTSSTQPFVEAVNAQYVLFPSGHLNRFDFPNEEIVARYQSSGAKIMKTGADGAISFYTAPEEGAFRFETYRINSKRYWYDR